VPEELLQRRQAQRRQTAENPVRREAPVGGHGVQVRVEVQQISEWLHTDDELGLRLRPAEQDMEALGDDIVGHPVQIPGQAPVLVLETGAPV